MDFTLKVYKRLLKNLLSNHYSFHTLQDFIKLFTSSPTHPVTSSLRHLVTPSLIIRHDVDRCPQNALKMAELEAEMSIKASYYFRIPKTFKPEIIKQIANLGHEIGYHYENLSEISKKEKVKSKKELFKAALKDFEKNLNKLKELYPVKTICMHGSPLSKWDNRDLWKKYDYRDFGIIAEPYFDIDFNEVFYITDASRAWNNEQISIRDKVESKFSFAINATQDIIKLLNSKDAPNKIMFNIHPEHWANSNVEWLKIWCIRKVRNAGKRMIVRSEKTRRGDYESG